MRSGVDASMGDAPFGYRVGALVLFLTLTSSVELWFRGRASVRWRASILILTLGALGALCGRCVDGCTFAISPEYFAVRKGLGWEAGLRERVYALGMQAGTSAGAVAGGVLAFANYRTQGLRASLAVVYCEAARAAAIPALLGLFLGTLARAAAPALLLRFTGESFGVSDARAFVVVWSVHFGVYAGLVLGVLRAVVRLHRHL